MKIMKYIKVSVTKKPDLELNFFDDYISFQYNGSNIERDGVKSDENTFSLETINYDKLGLLIHLNPFIKPYLVYNKNYTVRFGRIFFVDFGNYPRDTELAYYKNEIYNYAARRDYDLCSTFERPEFRPIQGTEVLNSIKWDRVYV